MEDLKKELKRLKIQIRVGIDQNQITKDWGILLLDNLEKAINFTHCSTQLKDKEKMNFGDWKLSQGLRYISNHTYKNAKNELFDADVVNKTYDDYYDL